MRFLSILRTLVPASLGQRYIILFDSAPRFILPVTAPSQLSAASRQTITAFDDFPPAGSSSSAHVA